MISIIIPTYNECDNIIKLINKIRFNLKKSIYKVEMIIVDDNSPDGTADKIREKYISDDGVRLFVRRDGRGLASAILYGIKKSKGNIIVGMDADFNHPPEKIIELVNNLKKSELAIASRFIKGGGMSNKFRYIFTLFFNIFLRFFLGFPTMDNMSGFYAIRKNTLLGFPVNEIYKGYGEYHLRLVYAAKVNNASMCEVPVYYPERAYGKSKSNLSLMFFSYLKTAIGLWLKK